MALFDLNRSNDTPIATLMVASIVPKNTHVFPVPPPAGSRSPVYVPVFTYNGGSVGDDVDVATSCVVVDDRGVGNYSPRNQAAKSAGMVPPPTLMVDIARARGWISDDQPYGAVGAAPTITSLVPATAVSVTGPDVVVVINGTGFTQWSTATAGGVPIPVRYVSATKLEILQKPRTAVAGTVPVVVTDHDVDTAPSNFVYT